MILLALAVFYGATTISLVESGCSDVHPPPKDVSGLCMEWWNKALNEYKVKPIERKGCIDLIVKKCPTMITTTSSVNRRCDGENLSHETWVTTVTASLKANTGIWMTYEEEKKKNLCYDNGVPDCNYWWKIAVDNRFETKIRKVCINRIIRHCRNRIEKISETRSSNGKPSKQDYDVGTVTYKYNGDTTTLVSNVQ